MKTQKAVHLCWLLTLSMACFTSYAFSAATDEGILQKATDALAAAFEAEDFNACGVIIDELLANPEINDWTRIRMHHMRSAVYSCQGNKEEEIRYSNLVIAETKSLIEKYVSGQTLFSQEQILNACRIYNGDIGRVVRAAFGNERPDISVPLYNDFVSDILKLGPFFNETGKKSILKLSTIGGWGEAVRLLVEKKQVADAHTIYENAINTLNNLGWASPELLEEPLYRMTIGKLVTSDSNDDEYAAAVSSIIQEKGDKSWIVYATISTPAVSMERRYELLRAVIDSNPTTADDNSMASLYYGASMAAREIGKIEEAVALFRTLKQRYPDNPLSESP